MNNFGGLFLVCYIIAIIAFVAGMVMIDHLQARIADLNAALFRCEHNEVHYRELAGRYFAALRGETTCEIPERGMMLEDLK